MSRTDVHIEVPAEKQKALGTMWNPGNDCFHFEVKLNFSPKSKKLRVGPDLKSEQIPSKIPDLLIKRMILSQVNSIYDLLGLASLFTVQAKILVRRLG